MNGSKEIMRSKVRILRPVEYKQLLTGCPKTELKTALQALMYTGMRYIEMKRFQKYPSWYDGVQFIHLPKESVHKQKRTQMERCVRLSPPGRIIIEYFINSKYKLPTYQTWQENLQTWAKRAGLTPDGLCSKTTRKTMESWLTFYYPQRGLEIALSQGHTTVTSLRHYLNMPFTEIDRLQMKEYVEGW